MMLSAASRARREGVGKLGRGGRTLARFGWVTGVGAKAMGLSVVPHSGCCTDHSGYGGEM